MKVGISDDALAIACGADAVATAFVAAGAGVERVSCWGMHWLEPLVDVEGVGYGLVEVTDVAAIMAGTATDIGRTQDHPFIARQTQLTFARAGKAHTVDMAKQAGLAMPLCAVGGFTPFPVMRAINRCPEDFA